MPHQNSNSVTVEYFISAVNEVHLKFPFRRVSRCHGDGAIGEYILLKAVFAIGLSPGTTADHINMRKHE